MAMMPAKSPQRQWLADMIILPARTAVQDFAPLCPIRDLVLPVRPGRSSVVEECKLSAGKSGWLAPFPGSVIWVHGAPDCGHDRAPLLGGWLISARFFHC